MRPAIRVSAFAAALSLAVPAAHAQSGGAADGDWEGAWRCEAGATAPAFADTAIGTINAGRVKVTRAGANAADVLVGTIDPAGTVVFAGRATGGDGLPAYVSFSGMIAGGMLRASGRVVPETGGAVQMCELTMSLLAAGGPAVVRGAPGTYAPIPPASPGYAVDPPAVVVFSAPYWYDDNYYWRDQRLRRWRYRHHDGHPQPPPPPPPVVGPQPTPPVHRPGMPGPVVPPPKAPPPVVGPQPVPPPRPVPPVVIGTPPSQVVPPPGSVVPPPRNLPPATSTVVPPPTYTPPSSSVVPPPRSVAPPPASTTSPPAYAPPARVNVPPPPPPVVAAPPPVVAPPAATPPPQQQPQPNLPQSTGGGRIR